MERSSVIKLNTSGIREHLLSWENAHPRPQFRRENYTSLNGEWDMNGEKITVPFPVESRLSGIGRHFPEGEALVYSRTLPAIDVNEGQAVLLHIDAVDQEADVLVNGTYICHITAFSGRDGIDISGYLKAEDDNTLSVIVTDDLNRKEFPYGKQTLKRGGMWYTPFSGIWQSVWLEVVPREHILSLKIDTDLEEAHVSVFGTQYGRVIFEGKEIRFDGGSFTLRPERPEFWSPEDPKLYEFTVRAGEDEVHSYFALRTLTIEEVDNIPRLCLNGKPYFFSGLLDQGYWPDGICTPPTPECFEDDIMAAKRLGFNTLRKHIKIEHERFYYDCDRLGMVVFQDMVNNGSYSFFKDTVLPTAGLQKISDLRSGKNEGEDPHMVVRQMFLDSMKMNVEHLYNHPSICYWTIFNEGWGQFNSSECYRMLKKIDSSRFVDTTSGWFRCGDTDVESRHVYFKKFKLPASDKPVVLSEFGGYSYREEGHCFNLRGNYGYKFFKDREAFQDALKKLYRDEIIPAIDRGLCGAIYTQLSDVEDETNGLLTYDRAVCKLDEQVRLMH